jgi:gliding motility-associated lipoprotein GldH
MKINPLMFLLMLWGISCSNESFEESISLKNHTWVWTDTLKAEPILEDTSSYFHSWIEVSLDEKYPYSNFFLKEVIISPGDTPHFRILEFPVSNPDGSWLSKKHSGNTYHFKWQVLNLFKINKPGKWKMYYIQYCRKDTLDGISNFTWKLQATSTPK